MITLQDIDIVMQTTNADYDTVRSALLRHDGNVASAIRDILQLDAEATDDSTDAEEDTETADTSAEDGETTYTYDAEYVDKGTEKAGFSQNLEALWSDIVEAIQGVWRQGNASRLVIEKDGEQILNLTLNTGIIGVVLAPLVAVLGAGVAVLSDYTISVILVNGEVVSINKIVIENMLRRKKKTEKSEQESTSDAATDTEDANDIDQDSEVESAGSSEETEQAAETDGSEAESEPASEE